MDKWMGRRGGKVMVPTVVGTVVGDFFWFGGWERDGWWEGVLQSR
jgi:hypothetical protein